VLPRRRACRPRPVLTDAIICWWRVLRRTLLWNIAVGKPLLPTRRLGIRLRAYDTAVDGEGAVWAPSGPLQKRPAGDEIVHHALHSRPWAHQECAVITG